MIFSLNRGDTVALLEGGAPASVVDEHVYPPGRLDRSRHDVCHLVGIANVGGNEDRLPALELDRALRFAAGADHHIRALLQEASGDHPPETLGAPRDDHGTSAHVKRIVRLDHAVTLSVSLSEAS